MSARVLVLKTKEGLAGFIINDIFAILPDINAAHRSVVYTILFPTGVAVEGPSEEVVSMWLVALEEYDAFMSPEIPEDEDDEEYEDDE